MKTICHLSNCRRSLINGLLSLVRNCIAWSSEKLKVWSEILKIQKIRKMNFPRYKFAKETKPELLEFLRVAKNQKSTNRNCDLDKHQVWNKMLPLDSSLIEELNSFNDTNKGTLSIVDLCLDEDKEIVQEILNKSREVDGNCVENEEKLNTSDLAYAMKENLESQNNLSQIIKDQLITYQSQELEELFMLLNGTLNSDSVFHLGVFIQNWHGQNDLLMAHFSRYLLIPRIKEEYCDNLKTLIDQLSIDHSSTLKEDFTLKLIELKEGESGVFLQYLKNLNPNYQSALLREFIFNIEKLNEDYLAIVADLLNNQVEYESLNKLVELMSNVAEEFCRDKDFGKLLLQTIQLLGPHLMHFEQPLKHLITSHKSVWKSKLEKTFDNCFEDSMMLSQTQSFT